MATHGKQPGASLRRTSTPLDLPSTEKPSSKSGIGAGPKQATDMDRLLGLRITAVRKAKGVSQSALGQAVGVTFQQVQKYEKGVNRVGAERLRQIANLLEVPISVFYGDERLDEGLDANFVKMMQSDAIVELADHFGNMKSYDVKRAIVRLVKSISQSEG